MSDYSKPFIDINNLLPNQFRDKTISSVVRNLFNKFVTKSESVPVYGFVGARPEDYNTSVPYITQSTTERRVNNLQPMFYLKHGTEEKIYSFSDVVNKMLMIGVDVDNFAEWGKTLGFNFAPPINLDKFSNFNKYFWVAETEPEFYVIESGGTSDWSVDNHWVHLDDVVGDVSVYKQALRPIIEYSAFLETELNGFSLDGAPSGNVTGAIPYVQRKTKRNQLPLFNLYNSDGSHSGRVSAIFYYAESNDEPIDQVIGRRVVINVFGDFTFEHGLIDRATNENYFYKNGGVLKSIWAPGQVEAPRYVKIDDSGFLLNTEKLKNYTDYYWYGHLVDQKPAHNPEGLPEYHVIQTGGSTGWSTGNYWIHAADAAQVGLSPESLITAEKPIVEFNVAMESQLAPSSLTKTDYDQHPIFILYEENGVDSIESDAFHHYVGPKIAASDPESKWLYKIDQHVFQTSLVNAEVDRLTRVVRRYKIGGILKNYGSQSQFLQPSNPENVAIVSSDPNGTWEIPKQIFHNLSNTVRTEFKQGDLNSHFISIIEKQDGFVGSSFGTNNYRTLSTIDLGRGGHIKQYNGDYNLFVGLMLQETSSPLSMVEFLKTKYDAFLASAREFVLQNLPDMITDDGINLQIADFDDGIYDAFVDFNNRLTSVATSSETLIDDTVSRLFHDSTSAIKNCVPTLPYLRLADLVQPEIRFDNALGIEVVVHHDGHTSPTMAFDQNYAKNLVNKSFKRSNGQTTPGVITHGPAPSRPFKGQFWYNTTTNVVSYYNVLSDSFTDEPKAPRLGDFWYDRNANVLKKRIETFDGVQMVAVWSELSNNLEAWTVLRFENIVNKLVLKIETVLHDGCPPLGSKAVDVVAKRTENVTKWDDLMALELSKFGAKYGVNVYSGQYDPTNAFTWNYKNVVVPGASKAHATWQNIYLDVYGTERPNLEPWKLVSKEKQEFFDELAALSIEPFTVAMWSHVRTVIGFAPTSVNPLDNTLLPPYVHPASPAAPTALLTTVPTGIDADFTFGENGPIELAWRKSIEFRYAELSTQFRLDPLRFVVDTWGTTRRSVDSYEMDRNLVRKPAQSEIQVHNETVTNSVVNGWLTVSDVQATDDVAFTVELVSSDAGLIRVTSDGVFVTYGYVDVPLTVSGLTFTVTQNHRGLINGDRFIVTHTVSTTSTDVTLVPTPARVVHGMSQVFSQVARSSSEDLDISLSRTVLKDWVVKLGYPVDGLLNTENLRITTDRYKVDDTNTMVRIKENRNTDSKFVTAIRISLARKGSVSRRNNTDVPTDGGTDWVYRVETFNPTQPRISFYDFERPVFDGQETEVERIEKLGKFLEFSALGKRSTDKTWIKYLAPSTVRTETTPFTITGIQNVVDFVFGYAKYLEHAGWVFNNFDGPVIDADTGLASSWALEIEKFIDAQYNGLDAGTSIVINPFRSKIWLKTPRGVVSSFNNGNVYDSRINQYVTDVNNEKIVASSVRVFRDDDVTEIVSDVPMYNLNATINEYEHVVLFDGYTSGGAMLYDEFLGIRVARLLFEGEKQVESTGRLSFGGHFVSGNSVTKNLDASIDDLQNVYNPQAHVGNDKMVSAARDLIGYTVPKYLADINVSDRSMFGFWRGLLNNKGSNFAIDAFVNSARYKKASIDEYWAYKLAEYGDARPRVFPELKIDSDMVTTQFTKFHFLESDNDPVEPGFIAVKPNDDDLWFAPEDIDTNSIHFVADEIAVLTVTGPGLHVLVDTFGNEIVADHVSVDGPVEFTRINASVIRIDTDLGSTPITVRCYGPAYDKFNPAKIIDYRNNAIVYDNLILWDPIRGSHSVEAIEIVDIRSDRNPAKFNYSTRTVNNQNYDRHRPWGEQEVGKVWWNTKNLDYVPYHDDLIFTDVNERISRWGATSDDAVVEVAEWSESSVHPSEWEAQAEKQKDDQNVSSRERYSGVPAFRELYKRSRVWKQREISWKGPSDPITGDRDYIKPGLPTIWPGAKVDQETIALIESLAADETGIVRNPGPENLHIKPNVGALTTVAAEKGLMTDLGLVSGVHVSRRGATGMLELDGGEFYIIGSVDTTTNDQITAYRPFDQLTEPGSQYFRDLKMSVNKDNLIKNNLGPIRIRKDLIGTQTFLVATVVSTGESQRLPVDYVTRLPGYRITFNFDTLGFTVSAVTTGGYVDKDEVLMDMTNTVAEEFSSMFGGSTLICAFAAMNANVKMPFSETVLPHAGSENWVAWWAPSKEGLENDRPAPYNAWERVQGGDQVIAADLATVSPDIQDWHKNERVHLGEKIVKYTYEWGDWILLEDEVKTSRVGTTSFASDLTFSYDLSTVSDRVFVYRNGIFVPNTGYTFVGGTVQFNVAPNDGDKIKIVVRKYRPTAEELAFDPSANPAEDKPLKLDQYKYDYQYTTKDVYDADGRLTETKYYFWVSDKNIVADGRRISLHAAAQLLKTNTNTFAILQGVQEAAADLPTRYTQFIVYGLNRFARRDDSYKIRFTKDFTLRDSLRDLDLKNVHTEWLLIRPSQKTRVPKKLWDLLTDAACGQNRVGEILPSTKVVRYDEKHGTRKRYGFGKDQILVDADLATVSIKSTIRNTTLRVANLSAAGVESPDFIQFNGFDITSLDKYFESPTATRRFLDSVWENAKPAQINEIFFTLLNDALSVNFEFTDIFKTSMISAHSIKLINTRQ